MKTSLQFKEWFDSTWELLELNGRGNFSLTWEEFQEYLEEAFEAGKESDTSK